MTQAQGGVPSTPMAPKRKYNPVFEKLVDGSENDSSSGLVGIVAYSLYKIAKREWMTEFTADNSRKPNDIELDQYINSWTDSRLAGVRTEANQLLAGFASYVVDQERPKIVKETLQHRSFLREAGVACAGAFFYTFLLILFALFLKVVDIDVISIFEKIGVTHHQIERPSEPAQTKQTTN